MTKQNTPQFVRSVLFISNAWAHGGNWQPRQLCHLKLRVRTPLRPPEQQALIRDHKIPAPRGDFGLKKS